MNNGSPSVSISSNVSCAVLRSRILLTLSALPKPPLSLHPARPAIPPHTSSTSTPSGASLTKAPAPDPCTGRKPYR